MKKNDTGFTVLGLLVVIIVLAAVGGSGWIILHKANTNKTIATDVEKTAHAPVSAYTDVKSHESFISIKEFGLKINAEDVEKLTYKINGTPNGTSNQDAYISDAEFSLNNSVNTSAQCKLLGIHIAQLSAAGDDTPKIGNYYYSFKTFFGSDDSKPCGDSKVDALRTKIIESELVDSAISSS